MSNRTRKLIFVIVFVVMAGGGYAASRLWRVFEGSIPQTFTDARLQGAIIAQNIVNLSNQSAQDLARVNDLDREGSTEDALRLTAELVNRSKEIRDEAISLSTQVGTMTRALSEINSLDARQAALESIASRLALVSRLINYSGYLGQLLDALQHRLSGNGAPDNTVQNAIEQVNAEVNAINNFNAQAGQAMDRFDKLIGE
ncbi:MAG: hypothetical protein A2945_02065 [Candidatus Liptonbacteria bacterium RIFCSPLOWO2_01_FULL_52_25]|uniref:Chemotaxis methyl-accepting receptor HlyB-like 4HB MCP domain-containing protein n=1 Tax=Candidatus Liptonbacteria bacterium RIFCSPLOWO2_01_FULL_52_25 TaxID=1798650 RepID=A0A1G2CGI3_9BACT|nr:MAG: hypothetical protein A2945_02065 [Candidatus Liptonbacteria bacterium RIFCSPLOWO2_01_FULL_52_25]